LSTRDYSLDEVFDENGSILAGWDFTYDAEGTRVKQVYIASDSALTTNYPHASLGVSSFRWR
jgi:hypothetical protein